jgi:outer membrane receptor protein involved in Fe transport
MPTFTDRYYRLLGNASVKPEYARQYNAGIVYATKHLNISADAYYNSIKDKIVAIPGQNLFVWTMMNLGKVQIKGIDVTAEADGRITRQLTWFARAAYTYQQAQDMTDPKSSLYKDRIPYAPDHSGSALASLRYGQWTAGYNLLFSATRYVLGENNPFNELDGFGVHDVFVSKAFRQVSIKAELNNITNQYYDVIKFYPMPGRSYKISLLFNNL